MLNCKSFILSLVRVLSMPVIVFALILYLRHFGDILTGVYILFPLCFIAQGVFLSKKIPHLVLAYILASTIILILTNMWYNVADTIGGVVTYLILGFIVYIIKKIILKQRECKKQ